MNDNNGGIPSSLSVLYGKNWFRWNKQMQSLFDFHETLEVVTISVHVLAANATDAQRVSYKDSKKKDCNALFCIQSVVDSANFDQIFHVESANEACDVLVTYYVGVADEHVGSKDWLLDTGCSNHMTGGREWLVDFDESKKIKIKLADNSSLSLNKLITQEMVNGIPGLVMPDKLYEGFLVGKESINSFASTVPVRSSCILEVVHSDVCGSFEDHSVGENMYIISFIDEYSRKLWIYVIKKKDEVFEIFNIFNKLVENQSEKKTKLLRIDGGGEYTSKTFEEFYEEDRIDHEVTAPHMPQHNGIGEIRNKTLLDKVRCILKRENLRKSLWGEVVTVVVYILNMCPTKK
ncbi:uncharacterized protein LOC127129981 [Lathyrus oleraceus]|uniref:uncharacterized protein LOC127129981 n=1 Tax=Pisum sativum TaxID=3888 RepID=UPI0021D1C32D|nr:uncharacterized protein LOC127129981 [Pisum sativum]